MNRESRHWTTGRCVLLGDEVGCRTLRVSGCGFSLGFAFSQAAPRGAGVHFDLRFRSAGRWRSSRVRASRIVRPTAPGPVLRMRRQLSLHRIVVLLELLEELHRAPHVEVVETPLPERAGLVSVRSKRQPQLLTRGVSVLVQGAASRLAAPSRACQCAAR